MGNGKKQPKPKKLENMIERDELFSLESIYEIYENLMLKILLERGNTNFPYPMHEVTGMNCSKAERDQSPKSNGLGLV